MVKLAETRFAFGTTATPKTRRAFTQRHFPIPPSVQCTAPREISPQEKRGRIDRRIHRDGYPVPRAQRRT